MSHPGKFVSVNLNRSYGQPSSSHRSYGQPSSSHSSSHGRPSRPAGGAGGGGGGGMVLLSRPRASAPKPPAPKLSVPPPLNLPSLRKEHERFDPAAATAGGGGGGRPGGLGSGHGPAASSVMGWTKPSPAASGAAGDKASDAADIPRAAAARPPAYVFPEKAVILRGEDFPSLKAAVAAPPPPLPAQRQKDADGQRVATPEVRPVPLGMRPQVRSSRAAELVVGGGGAGAGFGVGVSSERARRHDEAALPGPLPVVRLRDDSDWADDERDTGLSLPEHDSRDRGFARSEAAAPNRDLYGGGGGAVREPFKKEHFPRDVVASTKEGGQDGSWRSPVVSHRDRLGEAGVDRERTDGRPFSAGRGSSGQSSYRDSMIGGSCKDLWNARREPIVRMYGQSGAEAYGSARVEETASDRYGASPNNWYRGNSFQNNAGSKVQLLSGNKGPLFNEPVANFGTDKRLATSPAKPYIEDTGFDSIASVNLTAIKKKKEVQKPADFHDPVRESFEAELDRILRMQEQERQRVMEQQARAMEIARIQEEERERLIREEEERRRLMEEQARQAAWQEEQERLEAARRAEEQRIAREEEKRRIAMEEERRKEAARLKLLELEAKIARRQAESNTRDERFPSAVDERASAAMKDRDMPRATNVGDREDSDRMGERIIHSASSDSSSLNRYSETVPRVHTSRDGHSSFVDRGEHAHYGTRATFQDQENVHRSPRRDTFGTRRGGFPKKDSHDGFGAVSVRPTSKGGAAESPWMPEDYHDGRVPRWDGPRENNRFDRQSDFDSELLNSDRFGDAAWLPSSSHGSPHAQQGERMFQNSEANGFSSFTRSRYSVRQPRVLPPPTVSSMHRSSISAPNQRAGSSSFVDGGMQHYASRNDDQNMQSQYGNAYQEAPREHGPTALIEDDAINAQQNEERGSPRLGSQSSLSVSSPPSSPPHISHDEMDVSGDSPALPTSADGERTMLSDNDHAASTLDAANASRMTTSSTISHVEDDDWSSGNNEDMQQQDEYDEEGDSYQEDEINEGDDENLDLDDEFADLQLQGQNTPREMEQMILGFDEGVQVQILWNSELEINSQKSSEKVIGVQLSSTGVMEEEMDSSLVGPSKLITEAEKALQDLALDQVNSLTNENAVEPSGSSGVPVQETVTPMSSFQLPAASSAAPIITSSQAVVSQSDEVPVNLQFGLFSGPPLIPSPVPAIQIGSIQMPIHLHTQINPSLTRMHPSAAPLFQFGQLRYAPPISQNIPSLSSQTMPFIQSSTPTPYLLNQNPASGLPNQMNRDSYQNTAGDRIPANSVDKSVTCAAKIPLVQENSNSQQLNASANDQMKDAELFHSQMDRTPIGEKTTGYLQAENHRNHDPSLKKNSKPTSSNRESRAQLHESQFVSNGKVSSGPKAPGVVSGGRGRRYGYAIRDSNARFSGSIVEPSQKDSRGFQRRARRNIRRTEFRVRENVEKNQMQIAESFTNGEQDERPNSNGRATGISVRNVSRREGDINKSSRTNEASYVSPGPSSVPANFYSKMEKTTQRGPYYEKSHGGKQNSRIVAVPEEDVNPSLQSGFARVVKQQGIEVPVDADGFIEVRSKKQIMNVRREQREKENKSKMRMTKAPRKQHPVSLHSSSSPSLNKPTVSLGGEAAKKVPFDSAIAVEGRGLDNVEQPVALKGNTAAPSLPPIGPPSANTESHTNYYAKKPNQSQLTSDPVTSNAASKLVPCLISENNNKVASINTPLTLGSWDGSQINQQVMSLTQTQLEEAMKPAKFEQQAGSSFSLESSNAMTPLVTPEKPFPSSASPVNSLLAGEKIQFGAVTSPTVLPPVSRTISSGLGAPGSSRPDLKVDRSLPAGNNDAMMFFDKEKSTEEPCPNLQDVEAEAEAEAEAAASAVAVAAISSDEVVGSTIDTRTASASDSKSFSTKDVTGLTSGEATMSQAAQSSAEELLTVALPADLSVDTPSLSLWPPLPSPQASGAMLSQFPGVQPSHFSCFEMNPMLGGHIFAFGPSDESASSQSQPQRSSALPSAPLGAWPQCHSGVDSFYRPPTGFAGPFISPGGIPGVQGPPHMVVYNHFTPVGQFGQVGLGFMGTAYIPTDKQPDWKHNQVPSVVGVSQGDLNNQNIVSGQCTSPGVAAPIQHLRPTSPLMPIPSPLTMFDIAPFQSSTDIPMQPCWPHLPAPPLHSVPLSMPLQQHPIEGAVAPQFVHNVLMDNKAPSNNRFQEPPPSVVPSDSNRSFPNAAAPQFPDELGLVEQPPSSSCSAQTVQPSFGRASVTSNEVSNSGAKVMVRANPPNVNNVAATGTASNVNGGQVTNLSSKPQQQASSSSDQQYHHPVGNPDRRGRVSQKTGTGNEWHRRSGYQGRNQNTGSDKSFGTGRMKQIYVAKPSTGGPGPSG